MLSRLDSFEDDYRAIIDTYDARELVEFPMYRPYGRWMEFGALIMGQLMHVLVHNSVQMGATRLLAQKHGLEVALLDPTEQTSALPPWVTQFTPTDDRVDVRIVLSGQAGSFFEWARRTEGVDVQTLAHNGIRILGGLAVMPPESALVLYDASSEGGGLEEGIQVRMPPKYHLAGPLPADT